MTDSPQRMPSVLEEALRTARRIVVNDVYWRVYELPPLPLDRRNSPSLIFENENTMRRVRNYPSDWRTLTDDALFAISLGV